MQKSLTIGDGFSMNGNEVVNALDPLYPRIRTPLSYTTPFQLLIATVLSAQSTDLQVNKVTPQLFKQYPDPSTMSKARIVNLERLVRSTGFYHVKSRRIRDVSRKLLSEFGGAVPASMEQLTRLPGVGRKTANVVLNAAFGKSEGIVVDTHVFRVSRRIGIATGNTPEKVEMQLMKSTPRKYWARLSVLLILHGRAVCKARKPLCEKCPLTPGCHYFANLSENQGNKEGKKAI